MEHLLPTSAKNTMQNPVYRLKKMASRERLRKARNLLVRSVDVIRRRALILEPHPVYQVTHSSGPFPFIAEDEDPQFLLAPRNGRLPFGWVELTVAMKSAPDFQFDPRLYLDSGAGYSESNQICLPMPEQGQVHAIFHLPDSLRAIRFDPATQKGAFFVGAFNFREIGPAEALAKKCAWFVSDIKRRSSIVNTHD